MNRPDSPSAMSKASVVQTIFSRSPHKDRGLHLYQPQREKGLAFAPTNIALCKYWGKRDTQLNLPMTNSLSIALPDKGAMTTLTVHDKAADHVNLNETPLSADSPFVQRIAEYLDLFRGGKKWHLQIDIKMNVPVSAGLASSACGFASLLSALNDLFAWELTPHDLSILARLGSGSASRSFWMGFVEWQAGNSLDGMDSFSYPLEMDWPSLCVGVLPISDAVKPISSRDAMLRTVNSSALYQSWPKKVAQDLAMIKQAIKLRNFSLLGGAAESNALAMHATMLSSWPPICYYLPETIAAMHHVWDLRQQGLELYFTQDAGPNLKLLFLEKSANEVKGQFPEIDIIKVFE